MVKIEITGESAREALTDLHAMAAAYPSGTMAPAQPPSLAPAVSAPAPVYTPPAMPAAAPTPASAPVPPTAAPVFTYEQVGRAGADLAASNPAAMPALMALLQRYGVQAITDLKPEQLGPFATELRGLGARL